MSSRKFSRREFLRLSAVATAGLVSAACATETPEATEAPAATPTPEAVAAATAKPEATPVPTSKYNEAPSLKALVDAGKLPPVDKRLPLKPLVIQPVEEIGQYGGTWRRVAAGPGDVRIEDRLTYDNLVRWAGPTDISTVVPNLCKSWEVNDDATEFTFHLREGMRWSDGQPYTADQAMFIYEDCILNKDLRPTFPSYLKDPANGEPCVFEKIDDYTFKISFSSPYGLFMQVVAGPDEYFREWTSYCDHYLKQFHPKYTDKAELDAKVKDAGFDNWWELFKAEVDDKTGLDSPRLWAWISKQLPPDVPVIHERNPYYFKVDPEGNQLPYIDRIVHEVVENKDMLNMRAVAGEVDMQLRHIVWGNYPLFMENAEKGDYRVLKWKSAEASNAVVPFNLNHKDPAKRELFQNLDFRIAMSLAINRAEINEFAYMGMGAPRQCAVLAESPYFKPEHATKYAEYDPDRANELLDAIGLTERDEEGFRKGLDGEKLTIVVEYAPVFGPWGDVVTKTVEYWREVGIRAMGKEEARDLFSTRCEEGHEVDVGIWTADRAATPLVQPNYWQPIAGSTPCSNARDWDDWWDTGGEKGEEPPEEVRRQYELYDKVRGATSQEELDKYAQEFFDNAAEQLWWIGIVGDLPAVVIVKNNFRNVPEVAISDWLQLTPGNTAPEQYFFKA